MALLSNRQQAVVVNGSLSSWKDVTSGVPQGSVIGPALFLLYINDIHVNIKSTTRLFADDGVVYREIKSQSDHNILQEDLDTLSTWSKTWLMGFNIKKCAVLTITRKRKPSTHMYHLVGEHVPRVDHYKYLGVTISHDLRWNLHCQQTRHKASRTLGLLRRTLTPCSKEVKKKKKIEHTKPLCDHKWNMELKPGTLTQPLVLKISKGYRKLLLVSSIETTGRAHHHHSLSQTSVWICCTLADCMYAQASMLYKVYHNLVDVPLPQSITPASFIGRLDHPLKLTIPDARVDAFKYSFYPRTVRIWNRLPYIAVTAPSLITFREASAPFIRSMRPPVGFCLL